MFSSAATKEKKPSVPEKDKLNIFLLGEIDSNKVTLAKLFAGDETDLLPQASVGTDFLFKKIVQNGMEQKVLIWDTAGSERMRSRIKYEKAHVFIICFDRSEQYSPLDNVENWLDISRYANKNAPIIIVETQPDSRNVSAQDAINFALKHNAYYAECSLKSDKNIPTLFNEAMKLAIQFQSCGRCPPSSKATVHLTAKPTLAVAAESKTTAAGVAAAVTTGTGAPHHLMTSLATRQVSVSRNPTVSAESSLPITAAENATESATTVSSPKEIEMCAPEGPRIPQCPGK